MIHLRIDPVVNGWIVSRQENGSISIMGPTYVFNDVKDLQSALPNLLSKDPHPIGPVIDCNYPDLVRKTESI